MPAFDVPPALEPYAVAWVALVGAVVGSFLNVVIARVPEGRSIVHPPSACPRCHTPIRWYDNVPVLSFLVLRARCRSCGAPISWRYPLVEALGAAAAVIAYQRHGISGAALAELAFADLLLALSFIDLDTWLLPHALTWPLIVAGQAAAGLGATAASPRASAIGLVAGLGAFATVAIVGEQVFKKEALGWGDVWLLGGLGAWLGGLAIVPVVLLASMQGALVGVILLALGRGQPGPAAAGSPGAGAPTPPAPSGAPAEAAGGDDEDDWVPPRHAVPFGPFLAAAALEWLYLSDQLARAVPALRPFVS